MKIWWYSLQDLFAVRATVSLVNMDKIKINKRKNYDYTICMFCYFCGTVFH
jgi:hypothetical protein